jgi:presenilin 1
LEAFFVYLLFSALNWPLDVITFSFVLWNFSLVGIMTIFWHGPTKINQGYLILISGLLAVFFTRLPEWTTFAILAIVAVYDLFAVLCPRGPLKVLVETAQQRQEPIPALLYNASVFIMMADRAEDGESSSPRLRPLPQSSGSQETHQSRRKGVKLGLGDFVFYSVLVGRAAMYDMITVFTCFIGVITGLFFTLLLLAIFRKALPALPISIAFGIIFYFLTRVFLLPFVVVLSKNLILV